MNFKTTFVLLILAAVGVGLWLFGGESQSASDVENTEPTAQTTRRNVLDPAPQRDDIVAVRFERAGQPALAFEKLPQAKGETQPPKWIMIEPLECPAESYAASGLGTMFVGLQYRRSLLPGDAGAVSAADAGLNPPAATLTIRDTADTEYGLQIGKRVALSNDTYVRVVGKDEIYIVGQDFKRDLEKKSGDYRAKSLTRFSAADAREARIEHSGDTYLFTRADDDQWVISQPVRAYARQQNVKTLITSLSTLRVKEFLEIAPESLASCGLAPPFLTISVTTEREEEIKPDANESEPAATQPAEPRFETITTHHALEVGGFADLNSETRYVKLADQPWVAIIATQQLDKLIPKLSDLRDPKLTRLKESDATRIELTTGGVTTTLERIDGKWTGSGDLEQLDRAAVKKLLETVEDIRAIDYIDNPDDLAAYGLENPRAVLAVTTTGAVEPVTINIGADTPSGRNTYAQAPGQQSVMVISAARAAELAVDPISLRSRVITSSTPNLIKRLDVQRGDSHYALHRTEQGDRWEMLAPADAPPDSASIRDLVNDLSRLRAKRVVARDDFESYGLATPEMTISFVVERPLTGPPAQTDTQPTEPPAVEQVEHTLLVGRVDDRTFARIDDAPYVFELDQTVHDVFTRELIRHGLFDIKADAVAAVSIESADGLLEFAREGDQWVFVPDKFVKLSQEKVGAFVKELAELRVSAYMAYSAGDLTQYGLDDPLATVVLRLKDDATITLRLAPVRTGELPRKAAWVEQQRIFLLEPQQAQKLTRGLDYYVAPDAPAPAKPTRPTP